MTLKLGQKYWLTIPTNSKRYNAYKRWCSCVTGLPVMLQDIKLGKSNGKVDVVISYDSFKNWNVGLMVPSTWLEIHNPISTSLSPKFCKCAMDLLLHRGCQCGGV